jgi:putative Mg2+ transporter-C (MgtC) family protein
MTLALTWEDVALRIALTMLATGAIEGHSAGLRTTLFVALAACFGMLQANQLIKYRRQEFRFLR